MEFGFVSMGAALLALGACATSPVQFLFNEPNAAFDTTALRRGEISLDCDSLLFSFRWLVKQNALAKLHDEGDWDALAEQASQLNYDQDLAYYYLGRASEEQQAFSAAQLYFTRAGAAQQTCASGLINRCQGIDVSLEASIGRTNAVFPGLATPSHIL